MISIDRIICPLDFSVVSRSAFDHALALARRCGARITAVHVEAAPSVPTTQSSVAPEIAPGANVLTGAPAPSPGAAFDTLTAAIEPAVRAGVRVDRVIEQGNVVDRILDQIDSPPSDLLVLGTHGTGGFERLVMGSVAEKIIRKAPCPVLTVSPEATARAEPPSRGFRDIVCAIDFSEASLRALEYALTLADGPECELTLLHVLEPAPYGLTLKQMTRYAETDPQLVLETETRLEALLPDNVGEVCTPRVEVRAGRVHERILDVAHERGTQVVVMGVHGRGRGLVERLFLGSVANHVVRGAQCPVLSVREVTPAAARSEMAPRVPEASAPSSM